MDEWWTYRPSDFLMFAPATYWRLFELANMAIWPWPPVAAAAFATVVALARRHGAPALRVAVFALAVAWAWVAWDFLGRRYAAINWAAGPVALAFGAQAVALAAWGAAGVRPATRGARRAVGVALVLWALAGQPLLALLAGRPASQAEWFGVAPDPTLIATLGTLLLAQAPRVLWVLPLAAALLSSATLATMGAAQAVVPVLAGALALAAAALARRTRPVL